MPHHTTPHDTTPHHTIPYHTIPCHTKQYHTDWIYTTLESMLSGQSIRYKTMVYTSGRYSVLGLDPDPYKTNTDPKHWLPAHHRTFRETHDSVHTFRPVYVVDTLRTVYTPLGQQSRGDGTSWADPRHPGTWGTRTIISTHWLHN